MSLRALRDVLQSQNIPTSSSCVMNALARVTLDDLGFCASESAVSQWIANRNFPLELHRFSIRDALLAAGPRRWMGQSRAPLGCCTVYKSNQAIVSWFVIPPNRVLPLHDHSGMHVWQRVLFGEIRVTSFDWTDCSNSVKTREEMLKLGSSRARNGGEVVVVYNDVCRELPSHSDSHQSVTSFGPVNGGILHEIANESDNPALFIDVIAPPYETAPDDVQCTYFSADVNTVVSQLCVGQKVNISPRLGYYGPEMTAFIPVSQLF